MNIEAGKTFAIILTMLKYATKRDSTIVCFRRTSTQLRQNGGIWQEARSVFRQLFGKKAVIRDKPMEIYLPEYNSTIKFSHLQYLSDIDSHLGAQYSVVIFDEATLFDFDNQILPLMMRMRNARVDYNPVMLWATNPRYNHGIMHWIKDYYLDEEGIPISEKSNHERYFVIQDGKPIWYDNRDDAVAIHGDSVRSFRAIKAHVTDNKPLLKNNPDYLNNLMALSPTKKRIFLDGSWFAREEEAGYYKRHFSVIVPYPCVTAIKRVRAWDTASSLPSTAKPDPDWTRGVLMSKDKTGYITLEHVASLRDRPHAVEELIISTARSDPVGTVVVLNIDPASAGLAFVDHIKKRLAEIGVYCKSIRSNKSKLQRFLPFSAIAEAGYTKVVKDRWNDDWFDEAERFNGEKNNGHDDIVDAVSLGTEALHQGISLPSFNFGSSNLSLDNKIQPIHGIITTNINIHGTNRVAPISIPTFNINI